MVAITLQQTHSFPSTSKKYMCCNKEVRRKQIYQSCTAEDLSSGKERAEWVEELKILTVKQLKFAIKLIGGTLFESSPFPQLLKEVL